MKTNKWDAAQIPDQTGRVAIVTGASSGIGYETARALAEKQATVILAVRSIGKGGTAAEKIKAQHPDADVAVMEIDLSDLASVKKFAAAFQGKYARIDLLINNAGVMVPPYAKTVDGFELQFGTNHLGHFALTGLLMDLLLRTPASRIVNVSSTAHNMGNINFDDLAWEKRPYKAWNAYGDSKIANLYFTYRLHEKLEALHASVTVAAAHPGWTATELQRHSRFAESMNAVFAQSIPMGALPTLYAATDLAVKSGEFFGPSGFLQARGYPKKVDSNALSHDRAVAEKLWAVSEALTGVRFPV